MIFIVIWLAILYPLGCCFILPRSLDYCYLYFVCAYYFWQIGRYLFTYMPLHTIHTMWKIDCLSLTLFHSLSKLLFLFCRLDENCMHTSLLLGSFKEVLSFWSILFVNACMYTAIILEILTPVISGTRFPLHLFNQRFLEKKI